MSGIDQLHWLVHRFRPYWQKMISNLRWGLKFHGFFVSSCSIIWLLNAQIPTSNQQWIYYTFHHSMAPAIFSKWLKEKKRLMGSASGQGAEEVPVVEPAATDRHATAKQPDGTLVAAQLSATRDLRRPVRVPGLVPRRGVPGRRRRQQDRRAGTQRARPLHAPPGNQIAPSNLHCLLNHLWTNNLFSSGIVYYFGSRHSISILTYSGYSLLIL